MRYKVGDCVKVKSLDWYNENKDSNGDVVFSSKVLHFGWRVNVRTVFTKDMVKFCGKVVTIESVWTVNYSIVEGTYRYYFTDEMIEGLVEKEMSLDEVGLETDFEYDGLTYILPDGHIFKDENGNVINATKIILEKKKKEYLKTYEECCEILDITPIRRIGDIGYKRTLLNVFEKLLVCRDAYWKIAGDEMGLEKPWEPDWNTSEPKYVIACTSNGIEKQWETTYRKGFAFPTEEMRDAFYDNFKELIEQCKELL